MQEKEVFIILDNIRSVYNVGAIFRTADAAGVSKIYLCGVTPTPLDRFGRKRKDMAKSALGAEESVSWEQYENTIDAVLSLKKKGVFVIGVEQSERSLDYKSVKPEFPLAFVLGSETEGVDKQALDLCDIITEIPMKGTKESLNVSVSTGIVLFRILNI
jgi:tRNA G18 (ribose-2'-O)-methylase SpoU